MVSILSISVISIPSYADGRRARGRISGRGTDRDRRIEVNGKGGCYEKSMEQSIPDLEKVIIMSSLFEVTTDYILKGTEPVSLQNKKSRKSLYIGFVLIFATIAGIWSFTANRFDYGECFFIVLAGAAVGLGAGLVVQVISGFSEKLIRENLKH